MENILLLVNLECEEIAAQSDVMPVSHDSRARKLDFIMQTRRRSYIDLQGNSGYSSKKL